MWGTYTCTLCVNSKSILTISSDGKCRLCSSGLESLEHFLWECSHAQDVWSKVMRILTKSRLEGPISLGFALWWRLEKKDWISGDLGRLKAFCVQRKKCIVQQVRESQIWCSNRLSDIWPTIASITLCNIWKCRCKVGLTREESRPKETITALWYDLITNIRVQYEELEGFSDTVKLWDFPFNNHGQIRPSWIM